MPVSMRMTGDWDQLRGTKPTQRSIGRARKRPCHAKIPEATVLEVMRLRLQCGWPCRRIAAHLNLTEWQVTGITENGNGTRTVLINGTKP